MKDKIIPISRISDKRNTDKEITTDDFFQNVIAKEEDSIILDVQAFINNSQKSFSEEEIEELIERRRKIVIIDNRMIELHDQLMEISPYADTDELFAVSATLYNKKDFTELLDRTYEKLFNESAPKTGLPFEEMLDENQKETFRKLHRLLKRFKDHPEDNENRYALLSLRQYFERNVSPAQDLFTAKASNTKLFKEFDRLPSLLKHVTLQEIMIHLRAYMASDSLGEVISESPFAVNHIDYGRPQFGVLVLLMLTNTSLSKFLNEREKELYDELMKRYGKCRTIWNAIEAFEKSRSWNEVNSSSLMDSIAMYATRILNVDFEQFMASVNISKRDVQEMCAFAALSTGSDDLETKELQLVIEMIMYAFNYTLNQVQNSSDSSSSRDSSAKVEKYERSNQELKARNREIEKELKAEKELRKKAEEEIQKTKKFYKHTLEKENRSLKRENEDQAEKIKALEERIRILENQDRLEEISPVGEIQASGDPILSHGEEKDFWPDEEKELILDILNDRLSNLQEGSRRRLLVEDILKHNDFRGIHDIRKNNLRKTLRGFRNLDSATASKLKEQGFTVTKSKNHIKISYMEDPRYTISMPSTGSDFRNGDNLASQLGSLVF